MRCVVFIRYSDHLRESAANDRLFQSFSHISFSLQNYITTHFKTKIAIGQCVLFFFEIQAFDGIAYIQS